MNDILAGGIVAIVFLALGWFMYGYHAHRLMAAAGYRLRYLTPHDDDWLQLLREELVVMDVRDGKPSAEGTIRQLRYKILTLEEKLKRLTEDEEE